MEIRIQTRGGKLIEREAEVIDKIDNEGRQYSIALHGGNVYTVIDRDYYGPIYGTQAQEIGKRGGSAKTEKKAASSRENGRKGGRPKGFIGWEYWDGRNTTTGEPNPDPGTYHGRLSIAGSAKMFHSKKERDEWVERAPAGTIREAASRTELRRLMAGFTKENFDTYVESMEFDLDVDRQ